MPASVAEAGVSIQAHEALASDEQGHFRARFPSLLSFARSNSSRTRGNPRALQQFVRRPTAKHQRPVAAALPKTTNDRSVHGSVRHFRLNNKVRI